MLKQRKIMIWIAFLSMLIFIVLLFGFILLPVLSETGTTVMLQVGAQRIRTERLTKDVVLLANHPDAATRLTATTEFQNSFPLFAKAQNGLLSGDASLGLGAPPADIYGVMLSSSPDYSSLLGAFTVVSKNTGKIDPLQLQIILTHSPMYASDLTQVNVLWKQQIDGSYQQQAGIKIGLLLVLAVYVVYGFRKRLSQTGLA
jgi:hypothetical protein